ncbi:helix-turn-helix domain protein [Elusimicrobium minutum Pei191]|uniref:Helix-turn-helix domain protein n=1 Tax=Elusimicrobium minutum (strain Pei191) TaxID=445932 RepID=B2KBZ6_ELUMP|nr:helix-turn-helix transcriptional regulator [Elusimicrobium minutum]ACC98123.1 helix-turn-helix domain protein [Elusimicrobium minutum Pei191]
MKMGEKIAANIKRLKITKVKLAERIGISDSSAISQWVKGKTRPLPENLEKLASEFGITVQELDDDIETGENLEEKTRALLYAIESITKKMSFGVSDEQEEYSTSSLSNKTKIDVFMPKHIAVTGEAKEEFFIYPSYSSVDEYLPMLIDSPDDKTPFALKIESGEVYAYAKEGEYAVIMPADKAITGKTALVKFNKKYCIKKIIFNDKEIVLKSGKKEIKANLEDVEVLGFVKYFLRLQ